MTFKNLAVFISGQGSNLEVFLQNKDRFNSLFVVSSSDKAYGLQRAKNHQVDHTFLDKVIDWTRLQTDLEERQVDGLFLAGFLKIVPASFIENWQGRIFNLHPSMLPKFKGLNAVERAFDAQDDVGVSIHHVVPEVDAGELILQEIAVAKSELSNLSMSEIIMKTHEKEHQLVQRWIEHFS